MDYITIYDGDTARFPVDGGHIDVHVTEKGVLQIHGVESLNPHTHHSLLAIYPQSGNDIIVGLTPHA